MTKKRKRERTRWMFTAPYARGHIRVGRVHNCSVVPEDIVRLQIHTASGEEIDFRATLDEAATITAGLNYVVGEELSIDGEHVRKRYR